MAPKRDRWDVLGIVLGLLGDYVPGDPFTMAEFARIAKLPMDKLLQVIADLEGHGLVLQPGPADDGPPKLTERGETLLKHWREWTGVLQRFGLE